MSDQSNEWFPPRKRRGVFATKQRRNLFAEEYRPGNDSRSAQPRAEIALIIRSLLATIDAFEERSEKAETALKEAVRALNKAL